MSNGIRETIILFFIAKESVLWHILTSMTVERANKNRCKCDKPEILFEDKDYINKIIILLSSLYISSI